MVYCKWHIKLIPQYLKFDLLRTRGPWATSLPWENSLNQQTHMIIIMLIARRKNPLFTLWKFNGSSFKQTWIHIITGCFVSNLVKIGPVVLEKKILKFVNVFSLFSNYLPLEKGGALHLNKTEFPSPKIALCQVGLKLAQWF